MPVTISGVKYFDADGNAKRNSTLIKGSNPDVVLVLDISGSTLNKFIGKYAIPDLNRDGTTNTILDAEISASNTLLNSLIASGYSGSRVGLVAFGSSSSVIFDGLASATSGSESSFYKAAESLQAGGGTNYSAGLNDASSILSGWKTTQGNVIFLSDGAPNGGDGISIASSLKAAGHNVQAFGVGTSASQVPLDSIDSDGNAYIFRDPDELINVLSGKLSGAAQAAVQYTESGQSGVTIYVDANGNGSFDQGEPSAITDSVGNYRISTTILSKGSYQVREVVPAGYVQTEKPKLITINNSLSDTFTDVDLGNKTAPILPATASILEDISVEEGKSGKLRIKIDGVTSPVSLFLSYSDTSEFAKYPTTITVKADTIWESDVSVVDNSKLDGIRTSKVVLSAVGNATVGSSTAVIKILDNDTASIPIPLPAGGKTAADYTALAILTQQLPAYTAGNAQMDKFYYYVERYPLTLRTAFIAEYIAGRATNEAIWGQNHWFNYGNTIDGRVLEVVTGTEDTKDYGAYVENYGTTLLDIYRKDPRATTNGGSMSMFAWGKEHYNNWGRAEGREIDGGVDWGAVVRNDLNLYNKWQDAKRLTPTLSAFAYGFNNQSTITQTLNVKIGSDTPDKLTGSIVYGLNANDVLVGSSSNDILAGGFGDDLIVGVNGGNDTVYGGPGSDVFLLNEGTTLNIRDFRKGADMIQLGANLSDAGITKSWSGEDKITSFYSGSSLLAQVYGKTPTDFTYADSSNGMSKVYI